MSCGILWRQLPSADGEELIIEVKWEDGQDCSPGLGRTLTKESMVGTVTWGVPQGRGGRGGNFMDEKASDSPRAEAGTVRDTVIRESQSWTKWCV